MYCFSNIKIKNINMDNIKFDFNDILIVPSETTQISTRSEVYPYTMDCGCGSVLPLFAAPMDMVVNEKNFSVYINNGVNVCLPRNINLDSLKDNMYFNVYKNRIFVSISLNDAIDIIKGKNKKLIESIYNHNILIDIANGHMSTVIDIIKDLKNIIRGKIMVGNIANPETYKILSRSGADYIRVGIGFGSGCLTTMHTGVGYPMASLIRECYIIKKEMMKNNEPTAKIIADGGFKTYSDIIKALALGADYVMIGGIFNKALESCGDVYLWKINLTKLKVPEKIIKLLWKSKIKLKKKFRGMSTKEVQKSWGNSILKTSEGVIKYNNIEYTLNGWIDNFKDYLKSAMSYTNSKNLTDFIGNVKYVLITEKSYMRFEK